MSEKKEGEEETPETPAEPINQETEVETPAGETPAPEEAPVETPLETSAPDNTEVVKGDEEPVETPVETPEEAPVETPAEEPKGLSAEEVKALVDTAIAEAVKPLNTEIESLKKSLGDNEVIQKNYDLLKKEFDDLNKALSQEVFPERKSFAATTARRVSVTDSMVLGTIGR